MSAPLELDVLAAVRYLRRTGARTVSIVGGSMGGGAAGDASIGGPGEIDRLVLLAATGGGPPEKLEGLKLFIVCRDDLNADGTPRLTQIRAQFEAAPQRKELRILDCSAHAQYVFSTNQGERALREILRFLSAQSPAPAPPAAPAILDARVGFAYHRGMGDRVLVLGDDNRSCLTIVRSLGRQGLEVWLGPETRDSIVPRSRYVRRTIPMPSTKHRVDEWLDRLEELLSREKVDLVMPFSVTRWCRWRSSVRGSSPSPGSRSRTTSDSNTHT